MISKTTYPRLKLKSNIEKINQIGKLVAEIVEEALAGEKKEEIRIEDVEMGLRESLREIGQSALQSYREQADGEATAEIECECGGRMKYQRRRAATIWSVFGKTSYRRAYYAGCRGGTGCALLDERFCPFSIFAPGCIPFTEPEVKLIFRIDIHLASDIL